MKEITVKIGKGGKISVEVDGVTGEGCSALTAALISALGVVDDVKEKPQYFDELEPIEEELYRND